MTAIEKLQQLIDDSKRIVAFTGAGVSTESGIKDFRRKHFLPLKYWHRSFTISATMQGRQSFTVCFMIRLSRPFQRQSLTA